MNNSDKHESSLFYSDVAKESTQSSSPAPRSSAPETPKEITDLLRACRIRLGLTQKQVAAKLRLHPSSYGQYERGKRKIPPSLYPELAALFGISMADLIPRRFGDRDRFHGNPGRVAESTSAFPFLNRGMITSEEDEAFLRIFHSLDGTGRNEILRAMEREASITEFFSDKKR